MPHVVRDEGGVVHVMLPLFKTACERDAERLMITTPRTPARTLAITGAYRRVDDLSDVTCLQCLTAGDLP